MTDQPPEFTPLPLIPDEPVGELVDDRLKLEIYADTVASVALGTKGPFTIGVFGSWGDWDEQQKHPNRPVTRVSWYEAAAYASWRKARLPTEAEWERAARGREGRRYPWGDDKPTPRKANYGGLVGSSSPVGVYLEGATPNGIHDLAGNVWEWCADWYGKYPSGAQEDPASPATGDDRVLRGGSWYSNAENCRSASRHRVGPGLRGNNGGFRFASGT